LRRRARIPRAGVVAIVRVLVVGSGGREHALLRALSKSPLVDSLLVAPGNAGTDALARSLPLRVDDVDGLTTVARQEGADLVVVGPEVPLALGLADALSAAGVRVFGPKRAAARLESSKAFSKDLMRARGIPTADYATFREESAALDYLRSHPAPVVVKADGLAAGKGVYVCATEEEARQAIHTIMHERVFGAAGDCVIIEERLTGQEVSVLAFSDGRTVRPMISAQDHKAAWDGDRGPNTGGMGAYAPAPLLNEEALSRVVGTALQPAIDGLAEAGTPYVGVLYAGLMASGNDFRVLEFNCRFGDPEAQAILPLMASDLAEVILACVEGRLDQVRLSWRGGSCVSVVLASDGYPGAYRTGAEIHGLAEAEQVPQCVIFHAGTRREGNRLLTAGGRVLDVTAWDTDLPSAVARAYRAAALIHWDGMYYRRDIGAKGLAAQR